MEREELIPGEDRMACEELFDLHSRIALDRSDLSTQ